MPVQRQSHKSIRFLLGIGLSIVLLAAQLHAGTTIANSTYEINGCDPFGYNRQARLFRNATQPGDGFNTDLKDPVYTHLRNWARSSDLKPDHWYQMVAPHCHHYRQSSDQIIIQYPFGTGWLLSFFPEDKARRWLVITCLSLITVISIVKINLEDSTLQQSLRALNALFLIKILQTFWSRSDSLAPSILIAYITAELAIRYSDAKFLKQVSPNLLSLGLGLLLGFSITIRPGNVFFSFAALIGVCLLKWTFDSKYKISQTIAWGSLGYLPGVLSNAYFNAVNTGSAFVTTYTPKDTRFTGNVDTIVANLKKIPDENGWVLVSICVILLLISIIQLTLCRLRQDRQTASTQLLIVLGFGWASLIILVLFSIAKTVVISYYFAGQVAFVATLVCCCRVSAMASDTTALQTPGQLRYQTTNAIKTAVVALLSLVIMIQGFSATETIKVTNNPLPWVDRENTVIWADGVGSYLYFHHQLPTSKLLHGNADAQNGIIDYLQDKGVTQLFVDEFKIPELVQLLDLNRNLEKVGSFRDLDIYQLK